MKTTVCSIFIFFSILHFYSQSLVVNNPNTGNTFQVSDKDFDKEMSWIDAKTACEALGKGWRLPTKEELQLMYTELHKKGNGGFKASNYWSVSEGQNSMVYLFNFSYGFSISLAKEAKEPGKGNCWVRAVK